MLNILKEAFCSSGAVNPPFDLNEDGKNRKQHATNLFNRIKQENLSRIRLLVHLAAKHIVFLTSGRSGIGAHCCNGQLSSSLASHAGPLAHKVFVLQFSAEIPRESKSAGFS